MRLRHLGYCKLLYTLATLTWATTNYDCQENKSAFKYLTHNIDISLICISALPENGNTAGWFQEIRTASVLLCLPNACMQARFWGATARRNFWETFYWCISLPFFSVTLHLLLWFLKISPFTSSLKGHVSKCLLYKPLRYHQNYL